MIKISFDFFRFKKSSYLETSFSKKYIKSLKNIYLFVFVDAKKRNFEALKKRYFKRAFLWEFFGWIFVPTSLIFIVIRNWKNKILLHYFENYFIMMYRFTNLWNCIYAFLHNSFNRSILLYIYLFSYHLFFHSKISWFIVAYI